MVPTPHPIAKCLLRLAAVGLGLLLLLGAPEPCQAVKVLKRKSHKSPAAPHLRSPALQVPMADLPFSEEIEKYLGIPYRRGGSGRSGMDCSGFTRSFFADVFGIDLPHNSRAISRLDFMEELPLDEEVFRPSDLLFFGSGKNRINHVGIYLSDGLFVHASTSSGVTISRLGTPYWQKRLVASRRVRLLDNPMDLQASNGPLAPDGLWETIDPLQAWSLAYHQSVLPDVLDMGLELFQGSAWHATDPGPWRAPLASDPSPGADGSLEWQWGWRAHFDLHSVDGLQITPSLSRFEGAQTEYPYDDDWHAYTLATTFASPAARWSLILAAQAESLEAMFRPEGPEGSNWRSLDLALGFGYRIAEGVNLSIMGTRSAAELDDSERADGLSENVRDLFFRIEVVY
jgi:hypothetical protein